MGGSSPWSGMRTLTSSHNYVPKVTWLGLEPSPTPCPLLLYPLPSTTSAITCLAISYLHHLPSPTSNPVNGGDEGRIWQEVKVREGRDYPLPSPTLTGWDLLPSPVGISYHRPLPFPSFILCLQSLPPLYPLPPVLATSSSSASSPCHLFILCLQSLPHPISTTCHVLPRPIATLDFHVLPSPTLLPSLVFTPCLLRASAIAICYFTPLAGSIGFGFPWLSRVATPAQNHHCLLSVALFAASCDARRRKRKPVQAADKREETGGSRFSRGAGQGQGQGQHQGRGRGTCSTSKKGTCATLAYVCTDTYRWP